MSEIMEKLHQENFKMLVMLDDICKNHNIPYFLAAGTLLGAIRHQGFIPWDNDIDIAIRREDFEKLVPFLKEELDKSRYELVLPDFFGKNYKDMVPNIIDKKVKIKIDQGIDAFYDGKLSHLGLDFFIMDSVPEGLAAQFLTYRLEFLYGLLNGHRYTIDYSNYPGLLKAVAFVLKTAGSCISADFLRHRVEKVAASYKNHPKSNRLMVTNDLMSSFHYHFPLEWYQSGRKALFEGKEFSVPFEAEKALSLHFGDFMILPPENKRVPHLSMLGIAGDDQLTEDLFEFSD